MFARRWDKADATIIARQPKFSGDGTSGFEFVAEIRPASGAPAFRATLQEPVIATDFWPPSVGDTVCVLVKSNGKVKFDKTDPRLSVKAFRAGRQAEFDAAQNQPVPDPTGPAYGSAAGGGQFAFPPGNAQVFTVGSADPERIRAATEKLRAAGMGELADQIAGQVNSAGAAPGTGEPENPTARLNTLKELRDRGLMTEPEYIAQRQRILDTI